MCDLEPNALGVSKQLPGCLQCCLEPLLPSKYYYLFPRSHIYLSLFCPANQTGVLVSQCPTLQLKGVLPCPSAELCVLRIFPSFACSEFSLLMPTEGFQQVQGVYMNLMGGGSI